MHANTSLLQEVGTGEEIDEGFGDIRGPPPPSSPPVPFIALQISTTCCSSDVHALTPTTRSADHFDAKEDKVIIWWCTQKQICPKSDKKSYWYFHHKPCSCPNLSNNFKYFQIFLLTRNYSVITAAVTNWGGPMHYDYLDCLPDPDQGWDIGHKLNRYKEQTSFHLWKIAQIMPKNAFTVRLNVKITYPLVSFLKYCLI